MKNSLSVSIWLVLILFAATDVSFAQLINYNRRNNEGGAPSNANNNAAPARSGYGSKKQAAQPAVEQTTPAAVENTASATPAPQTTQEPQAMQQAQSDIKVKSRVEELYDTNRDGTLQQDEVNTFLKDVVSAVDRRGTFSVSSDILRDYDKNKDGVITKNEIKDIPTVN